MNKVTTTVVNLRAAAKNVGITGVSKLRKAELEATVMKERGGRKAVYTILEGIKAQGVIENTLTKGGFYMARPALIEPAPVSGTFSDLKELKRAKEVAAHQANKKNNKRLAAYFGLIKAIKTTIKNGGYRNLQWHEDDRGFSLCLRKRA